jgi:mannose-1-phosphate guanylyltransferase/mannose-6-phosphate isomerase
MKKLFQLVFCVSIIVSGFQKIGATEKTVKNKNVYCVILAGGSGTRLWPLSRAGKPKQFLAVGNEMTLLQQAVSRVSSSVPKENIWIGTTQQHEEAVRACVGDKIGNIVIEPGARNTAPAILLSCFHIYKCNPDAAIVFLPSDPFIPNTKRFVSFLNRAIDYMLKNERISLLGLKPRYPATGYGYIEYDDTMSGQTDVPFVVKKFHEKPVFEVAQRYCQQGNMLWNISMFCAQARVFLDEFQKHAPDIFEGVKDFVHSTGTYEDIRSESIDYALMEKSSKVSVFPVDFEWCDVGNIEVFLSLQKQYGLEKNDVLTVDSNNNLVHVDDRLVALVGVDNLCIVQTDDVLLITKRDESEKVKQIVQKLKRSGRIECV